MGGKNRNMKLDYDCVRSILLELEEKPRFSEELRLTPTPVEEIFEALDRYSDEDILYSIEIMKDAELIKANLQYGSISFITGYVSGITYKGHELLDSIRDRKIWQRLKQLLSAAGATTFDIIIDVAKDIIKSNIRIN